MSAEAQHDEQHIDQFSIPWGHPELVPAMHFDPNTHIVITGGDVGMVANSPLIPPNRLGHNEHNQFVVGVRPEEVATKLSEIPLERQADYFIPLISAAVSAAGSLFMVDMLRRGAKQEVILQLGLIKKLIANAQIALPTSLVEQVALLQQPM